MIQAIFFDIDGTLLDFQTHKIAPSTIEAIQKVQKKGIKVALSSARPKESIDLIDQIHEIKWDAMVSANGVQLWDGQGNLIQDHSFELPTLEKIFRWAEQHNIPMYTVGEKIYYTGHNSVVDEFVEHFHLSSPVYQQYNGEKQLLMTLISKDKSNYHELEELDPNLCLWDGGEYNVDVFPKGISKWTGIQSLMDHWHFEKHNFMSFGDTKADQEMIQEAQIGVAMHNGDERIKKVADYVCPTDSIDSIAQCLSYYRLMD